MGSSVRTIRQPPIALGLVLIALTLAALDSGLHGLVAAEAPQSTLAERELSHCGFAALGELMGELPVGFEGSPGRPFAEPAPGTVPARSQPTLPESTNRSPAQASLVRARSELSLVAEWRELDRSGSLEYAAAALGVTPATLLANHPERARAGWFAAGSVWRLPLRQGRLERVGPGDTLGSIARRWGARVCAVLADPAHGVRDANRLRVGQELILPFQRPRFHWPAHGPITDTFGSCRSWDCSRRHRGLDLGLTLDTEVRAAAGGRATYQGGDPGRGLGLYLVVEHERGWRSLYAHLSGFAVAAGERVAAGDLIGWAGESGDGTGPHLHFELRHGAYYVDPLLLLPDREPEHLVAATAPAERLPSSPFIRWMPWLMPGGPSGSR